MKTPPAEMTSGCCPGNPQCPFPAEKMTMIPCLTALAMAAARAWSAADKGGYGLSPPQLHEMICGPSATAALKAPVELIGPIFTIVNSASGATENTFADSPVP